MMAEEMEIDDSLYRFGEDSKKTYFLLFYVVASVICLETMQ